MKKLYSLLALAGALFFTTSAAAQYCTPPDFLSGPYTGITNVTFNTINNTTLDTDGYTDYTGSVAATDVDAGSSYAISLSFVHTVPGSFTGDIEVRVWIDWNQDEDFDDAGEQMITALVGCQTGTGSLMQSILVPATALSGNTRMRVYEDMPVVDGHEPPNPCGYNINLGQHGECEDYLVNVVGGATNIRTIKNAAMNLAIYPNPSTDQTFISFDLPQSDDVRVEMVNVLGKVVNTQNFSNLMSGAHTEVLDVSVLSNGTYFLNIYVGESVQTKKVVVNR